MTHSAAPVTAPAREVQEPPFPPPLTSELLKLLVKAVRAQQLYLPNNPVYLKAIELLRAAFEPIWKHVDEFGLIATETQLQFAGVTVLEEPTKSADSLPWLLYKDGIRELRIQRGFEVEELGWLLEIILRVRHASPEEDDLITLLWEKDFVHLRYRFIDLALESAPQIEGPESFEKQQDQAIQHAVKEEVESVERSGMVRLEDFDATLYFLDQPEVEYLRAEIAREYAEDLRANVVSMLLDIFEQQTDRAVRDEIVDLLDSLVLHLLSASQFPAVAFLLRESATAAGRARDLQPGHRTRLASLPDRLSGAEALSQLIQSLDEAAHLPGQSDLTELFLQLRPAALGTVFAWLPRVANAELREMLEKAAGRLASANTGELVRLIGMQDDRVAAEAMRRAGALKTAAAVTPLGKVLGERDAKLRLVAVHALAEIATPGALQVLERAIEDRDREVRIATIRALAARGYRVALPRLETVIRGKGIREADLTEKMAFFEAYGALAGNGGVAVLDPMLNGKGFLGRREDPELRACAAMALGRIGSPDAMESLRRVSGEKEVLVRNAVNRALRGTTS